MDTPMEVVEAPRAKWRRVQPAAPPCPLPRHGHKAVSIKDWMIVFGGGNEGIVNELYVFNTNSCTWFKPIVRGEVDQLAAFGMDCDGEKIYIFGGMVTPKKYSDTFYELDSRRWEYRKLPIRAPRDGSHPPCARLGHSLNVDSNGVCYIFGGMTRDADETLKYLNDLYMVDMNAQNGLFYKKVPESGAWPCVRESHTASLYEKDSTGQKFLFVYGGMNGDRLGDIWLLDLVHLVWREIQPEGTIPLPRSLHSACLVDERIYVFGGWVPVMGGEAIDEGQTRPEWRCSNDLLCFNIVSNKWELFDGLVTDEEDQQPRARAGHSACVINSRIYIWSGRDGVRRLGSHQICCKDMYFLEVEPPTAPPTIQLVKAGLNHIELTWPAVPNADYYKLQMKKVGVDSDGMSSPQPQHLRLIQNGGPRMKRISVAPGPPSHQGQFAGGARTVPGARPVRMADSRFYVRQQPALQRSSPNGYVSPQKAGFGSPAAAFPPQPAAFSAYGTPQPAPAPADTQMPSNILEDTDHESSTSAEVKPEDQPKAQLQDPASISLGDDDKDPAREPAPPSTPQEQPEQQPGASTTSPQQLQDPATISLEPKDEKPEDKPQPVTPVKPAAVVDEKPESAEDKPEPTSVGRPAKDATTPTQATASPTKAPTTSEAQAENEWITVDSVKENTYKVRSYCPDPQQSNAFVDLQPGFVYQFRVAAVNALGVAWSATATFRTCVPGYPGAPSSIKITKGKDCAHLSWEPPANPNGQINEYSVYLAMKNNLTGDPNSFLKVYSGAEPACVVAGEHLEQALVDATPKPAVIFRIAAKNQKGYGPATQVRWLQETRTVPTASPLTIHRAQPLTTPTYTKRLRIE